MGLKLLFLGTFQVLHNDDPITSFRSVNVQGLLAYLAIEADRPHTRESLATLFWPDAPTEIAKQNLRQTLYLLKKSLGSGPVATPYLRVARNTVQFNAASDASMDVAEFNTALAAGDLKRAASWYRGDLLAGLYCESVVFEEWMVMLRERLHHQALDLFHRLAEESFELAEYELAQRYARRQLEMEPWREEAHRQLMHFLSAAGDRQAALAQFERCRQVLADQLNVEPSAATRALYEAIHDGTDSVGLPSAVAPAGSRVPQHNLPRTLTPFIGREEEIRALTSLLKSEARLVTLLGEGGIGKARLALATAEQLLDAFADGVRFVPLAGVAEVRDDLEGATGGDYLEGALLTAIANACHLPLAGEEPLQQRLLHHLHTRQVLLILDNFEHLAGAAPFLMTLLQHAPQLTILLTSRVRLDAHSEYVFPVVGLPVPGEASDPYIRHYSSVQLFIQTARRKFAALPLDESDLEAISRICRHVQGMPLGIELAAALAGELTITEIAAAIEQNLDILATTQIDLPSRHRSLRAVFDSSWHLLVAHEEALLAQLSVFAPDFTRESALGVTRAQAVAFTGLTHKSLLRRQSNGRYALHPLLRQFASEKLAQRGETAAVQRAHAFHYLRFVAQTESLLHGEQTSAALAGMHIELDNVRQAWFWAVMHHWWRALDIGVNGLARFLIVSSLYQEGERALAYAIDGLQKYLGVRDTHTRQDKHPQAAEEVDLTILLGTLQAWHACFLNSLARYDHAVSAAKAALAAGKKRAFVPASALGYLQWGMALWYAGDVVQAQPLVLQALTLAQGDGPRSIEIDSLRALGAIAVRAGDNAEAIRLYRRALYIARKIGDRHRESQALHSLGSVTRNLGDYSDARTYLEKSLQIYQHLEDRRGECSVLNTLGDTAYYLGHYMAARDFYQQSLEIAEEISEQRQASIVLANLGILHRDLGDYFTAERYLDLALARKESIGFRRGEGWNWICMALLRHQRDEHQDALTFSRRALALFQMLGDQIGQAYALTQYGHALAGLCQWEQAIHAYEQALALRRELKQPHLALDVQAGLARIALVRGDVSQAMQWVESILSFLRERSINGTDEPGRIYLTCYQTLTAIHDPRAASVLHEACQLLQERATRVSDLDLRRSYLDAVPAHRALMDGVKRLPASPKKDYRSSYLTTS